MADLHVTGCKQFQTKDLVFQTKIPFILTVGQEQLMTIIILL